MGFSQPDATEQNHIAFSLYEVEVKYQEKIHYLEEQLRLFKNELFGRRSERRHEVSCPTYLFQINPT